MGKNKALGSETKLFGLIGNPIKHSLSPNIHNYIFKKYNINAVYLCFSVEENRLKETLFGAGALGVQGLNVTIPYKDKVIKYLDKISPEAKLIGAVNTLKFKKGKILGFNTDGEGFILSLKKFGFSCEGKDILILGAGGAAKAIGIYSAKEKAKKIYIYDVVKKKTDSLARRINENFPSRAVALPNKVKSLENYDLIVNATGIGLKKSDSCLLNFDSARPKTLAYDLIYNPAQTNFLLAAKKRGLKIINGLWMLIFQALSAENIWLDKDFSSQAPVLQKRLSKSMAKEK